MQSKIAAHKVACTAALEMGYSPTFLGLYVQQGFFLKQFFSTE